MSEEQAATLREIRRIVRVLERLGELAKQATRKGELEDGQAYAIRHYNAIIEALAARGIEVPGFFPPLPADAGLGAVGFASAQLAEYLSELLEPESSGFGEGAGTGGEGSFFNQFFGSGEFQHIGEAMRQAIPDFMREAGRGRADREARRERERSRGAAEKARTEPSGSASPAEGSPADELEGRLAEVSARMVAIAAQMQQCRVKALLEQKLADPEELQRLAAELARLGEEQARIVREARRRGSPGGSEDVDSEV